MLSNEEIDTSTMQSLPRELVRLPSVCPQRHSANDPGTASQSQERRAHNHHRRLQRGSRAGERPNQSLSVISMILRQSFCLPLENSELIKILTTQNTLRRLHRIQPAHRHCKSLLPLRADAPLRAVVVVPDGRSRWKVKSPSIGGIAQLFRVRGRRVEKRRGEVGCAFETFVCTDGV